MSHSLNEFEALCKKAAKGSGFFWGHAEEAGRAARLLSRSGIDNGSLLLVALEHFDENCSLWIGPALCDAGLNLDSECELEKVRAPGILLAFLNIMVADNEICLEIEWTGFKATISAEGIFCDQLEAATVDVADRVIIRRVKNVTGVPLSVHSRAKIPKKTIEKLLELAGRTYAPATEASRLAGAGAGLSDND
jgi:hypothetical protein